MGFLVREEAFVMLDLAKMSLESMQRNNINTILYQHSAAAL